MKTLVSDSALFVCLTQLRSLPRLQHSLRLLWPRERSVRTFPISLIFVSKCSVEYSCIYFLLYVGSCIHTSLLEVSSLPDDEERDSPRTVGLFGIQPPDEAASPEHLIERTPSFRAVYRS